MKSATEALAEAQAATYMGAQAETALRDTSRLDLQILLEKLRNHVQSVADSNVDSSPSIIERSCIALPSTTKASTTIAGLPPGARVWVRYRTIVKSFAGDWSHMRSIIVG